MAAVKALDEDALNRPTPASAPTNPVWGTMAGNTYRHHAEQGEIIRRWLVASSDEGT
ncbi:MAG TPA: hypothetical protein VGR57_14230 [Ktedonobacterales bacterium]|nr:hypothetical protein [Ktedonobacterales bacterium]